jgi:hypothetical protein
VKFHAGSQSNDKHYRQEHSGQSPFPAGADAILLRFDYFHLYSTFVDYDMIASTSHRSGGRRDNSE